MTTYLLDVNLLLALTDPQHIHHEISHHWFADSGARAWATCPLTENGFVRIASHPRYPNRPGGVGVVVEILLQFCAARGNHFWSEDVSIRDLIGPETIITHAQITDVFLLGLAMQKHGKLATLDQHLPAVAIRGGSEALEMIVP
ncbi:MAG: TA system VapC family ribonuclease toxin [Chloroflexota bacterium]